MKYVYHLKNTEVIYSFIHTMNIYCHNSKHWGNNGGKRKPLFHETRFWGQRQEANNKYINIKDVT